MLTAANVLKRVKDEDVRFIKLWFVDILGTLKSISIRERELEKALEEGIGFDGSSVEGFARIYESDLLLKPEPATFRILPRRDDDGAGKVGVFFCDIATTDNEPYPGDPRGILKKMLARTAEHGYVFNIGPELEYFYFQGNGDSVAMTDTGGYFDFAPLDLATDLRRETINLAERMGIQIDYSHHEVAPSQHELDLRYGESLEIADKLLTVKVLTKEVARKHNQFASFMPKPIFGRNGSGMHLHMSLFKNGENAFFDGSDPDLLSPVARAFAAGVLAHCRGLTLFCNQWVNSYKRLVPGYEAPVYIAWARNNRSSLVRIPAFKHGKPSAARIELRSPDPACNPYLAFAAILAAGLDGIENKLALPAAMEEDIFAMSEEQRHGKEIFALPGSLLEAVQAAAESELMRRTMGEHIFGKFLENKRLEWDAYRIQVSRHELETCLPRL